MLALTLFAVLSGRPHLRQAGFPIIGLAADGATTVIAETIAPLWTLRIYLKHLPKNHFNKILTFYFRVSAVSLSFPTEPHLQVAGCLIVGLAVNGAATPNAKRIPRKARL